MVALTLAGEVLRKFGGDSVTELVRNAAAFAEQVRRQVLHVADAPDEVEINWDERLAFADVEAAPAASGEATDGP
jgi:hypothetical protein